MINAEEVVVDCNQSKRMKLEGHVGELRARCQPYEERLSLLEAILIDKDKLLQNMDYCKTPKDGIKCSVESSLDASTVCSPSTPSLNASTVCSPNPPVELLHISTDVVVPLKLDLQFQFDEQLSDLSTRIEALEQNANDGMQTLSLEKHVRALRHKVFRKVNPKLIELATDVKEFEWMIFTLAAELKIGKEDLIDCAQRNYDDGFVHMPM